MSLILLKKIPNVLKDLIRSTNHYKKIQDKNFPNYLASTSKRLDICAAQFSHTLHLSNLPSLDGKICLEIGSGYVLSHAIICHLLGAKKVIATDVFPHAKPSVLYKAIHESIHSIVRDILSPFEKHERLRLRLDNLLSIEYFDFNVLKNLGIEYVAPIDLAKEKLSTPVDFVFSNSVLEHVPCDDVSSVLRNIYNNLNPNGAMIHCIHLEDHKDIPNDPFSFLQIPAIDYPPAAQSSRGNRMRKSDWQAEFNKLTGATTKILYEWRRVDKSLPIHIDKSIELTDQPERQTSHVGMFTTKTG